MAVTALAAAGLAGQRLAGRPWSDLAPFHLCDMAIFVALFALATRAPLVCEVLYFWACAGTLLAIIILVAEAVALRLFSLLALPFRRRGEGGCYRRQGVYNS